MPGEAEGGPQAAAILRVGQLDAPAHVREGRGGVAVQLGPTEGEQLDALTNVRVVRDPASATGWRLEIGHFPGWKDVPTW